MNEGHASPWMFRPGRWIGTWMVMFALLLFPKTGAAHPFGNNFFAQQSVLKLQPDRIRVDYLIEIPTTIIMREFYVTLQGRSPSRDEDAQFTKTRLTSLLSGLTLAVNGTPLKLVDVTDPLMKNGVGNMNFFVYRLAAEAAWSPETGVPSRIVLETTNFRDKETYFNAQVWASDAVKVAKASSWDVEHGQGQDDESGRWLKDKALSRLEVEARVLAPTGGPAVRIDRPLEKSASRVSDPVGSGAYDVPEIEGAPLLNYLRKVELDPWFILAALGMALFLGAAHALSPGHGKTLVAAYLVGSRGTIRHAIFLGLVVTLAHTSSIIVLGVVTLFAQEYILPERLYRILGVLSGATIVWIGIWMIRDRWRHRKQALVERSRPASEILSPDARDGGGGRLEAHEIGALGMNAEWGQAGAQNREGLEAAEERAVQERAVRFKPVMGEEGGSGKQPFRPGFGVLRGAGHVHVKGQGHSHDHGLLHDHGHTHDHGHLHDHPNDHSQARAHARAPHLPDVKAHRAHTHGAGSGLHHHWGNEHAHVHDMPEEASLRQLVKLGIAGGIVPCPAATVVLLTAIALHRVAFGLVLVVAFSVGLAAVLVAIGIILVMAGGALQRFSGSGRVIRHLPLVSAVIVTVLGVLITWNAWRGHDAVLSSLSF